MTPCDCIVVNPDFRVPGFVVTFDAVGNCCKVKVSSVVEFSGIIAY
jgi:hypothetical protein